MKVKTIITDKAEVRLLENNIVEKIFFEESRARKEYDSLCQLYGMYQKKDFNQWTYKTVKPLNLKNEKIEMELATGITFEDCLKKEPSSAFLTGIWFGFFHNYCRNYEDGSLRNIDYNRKNVLMDYNIKTVTVIDPGGRYYENTTAEEAVINFIVGLVIGALEQKKLPKPLIKHFLNGYFTVSKEKFNLNDFKYKLGLVIKTRFNIQKGKDKNKLLSFVLLQLIKGYVSVVTPSLLKKAKLENK